VLHYIVEYVFFPPFLLARTVVLKHSNIAMESSVNPSSVFLNIPRSLGVKTALPKHHPSPIQPINQPIKASEEIVCTFVPV
jgi:hypothetical protein